MKYTKDYTLGGSAYPVRHYLVAIRLRTISSVWGHFGCFTRSAFRRTPSLYRMVAR